MASRKPTYAFSSGPNSHASNQSTPNRPVIPPQTSNNPFGKPAAPPNLLHNPLSTPTGPQRRGPYQAPGISPANSPSASQASLLLPKGPPRGPPSQPNANLAVPRGPPLLKSKTSDSSIRTSMSMGQSISDKYSLGADPSLWGADLSINTPESDDYLHNPDPRRDRKNDEGGTIFTKRGLANLGCLLLLALGLIGLFAGYPLISYFTTHPLTTLGAYNLGGINGSGQVPNMPGNWGLIDADTPEDALTKISYTDGEEWKLVFSDEFNLDGRSFFPGDDPYWEAVDLHYWGTNNLEWYSPEAITTKDGNMVITLEEKDNHDLKYEGGMVTTWNKFCFTGGLIEVNAVLPGASDVWGLWPAVWTMGNLGRAGFGATLDGMWPYSYDSCDVATLANQTTPDGLPTAARQGGYDGTTISYLPGQRLSACTCPDEIHPGPKRTDGTWVGRAAPEIDVFEAQVSDITAIGHVSQSVQWAPFNKEYLWDNTTENCIFHESKFHLNTYRGGVYQQTTSGIGDTNQACYEQSGGCYSIYGFEYRPGNDGFITWVSEGKASWTMRGAGMKGEPDIQMGSRPVPLEPMYIIMNLGMSENFGEVDFDNLKFPVHLYIDYVRIYQPKDQKNIGCDPDDFPTSAYIDTFIEAYTNPNLTTWEQFGQRHPKNKLIDDC